MPMPAALLEDATEPQVRKIQARVSTSEAVARLLAGLAFETPGGRS